MSSSREDSPDWLRTFQTPTQSTIPIVLSPSSESPPDDSPVSEDEDRINHDSGESPVNKTLKAKSPSKKTKAETTPSRKRKKDVHSKKEGSRGDGKVAKQKTSDKPNKPPERNHSVLLSSDSESCPDASPIREDNNQQRESSEHKTTQYAQKKKDDDADLIDVGGESPLINTSKVKSPEKRKKTENHTPAKKKQENKHIDRANDADMEVAEEEMPEKQIGPYVSSSRLPLVLSEKVQRSKALVECEGESIDLSGDVGAVGRMVVSDNASGNHETFIDLKGTIYKSTIMPSRTFCVVSFGQSEAKVEAIMNDFIQLKPQSNVYEAETMVEGTLDGFSFDMEDEADNLPKPISNQTDQNEGAEEKSNGKTRKKAEKTSGPARKKGKTTGGKPPKKVKKKSQVPKKTKTKK